MSASEKELKELHSKLANKMGTILEGEDVTAAQLNVIRSFLSDNSITCTIETNEAMSNLKKKLQERKANVLSQQEKKDLTNVVSLYGTGDTQ